MRITLKIAKSEQNWPEYIDRKKSKNDFVWLWIKCFSENDIIDGIKLTS